MTSPSNHELQPRSEDPGECTLEAVLTTAELATRPSRAPDFRAENEALVILAGLMVGDPVKLLQKLVDMALVLCQADSAGISIEEPDAPGTFRWATTAGAMARFQGGTMPRDFSPCGVTVDRGCTQLMTDPVRFYPYIASLQVPVREVLLVPFHRGAETIGTVWIVSHERVPAFDAESARLMESLAHFAAVASESLLLQSEAVQMKQQVQEMKTKLEAGLQAGAIATWSWDIINDRVFADSYCASLFAISEADAQGGPISKYVTSMHPDDRMRVGNAIQKAVDSGGLFEIEYRLASGSDYRWVIARGKVLRDATGRPTHFPGVIVDITERKRAQLEVDERQRALWAGLPVACYTLDADGWITFFNEAAATLWGRRPELGRERWSGAHGLMGLDAIPIPPEKSAAVQAFKERRSVRGVEVNVVRPDGSRRWVTPHADPIFDTEGRLIGLISVLHDVTEERVASAALREARDQAVAASRAKDDFLAALSHELRTPLNPVLLLASDAATNKAYPAEIRAEFETVRRNVELEARLIDDLLDVTRISRGKLNLECVSADLHAILLDAASKVQTDVKSKTLTLTWDLAATQSYVYGDPVRLQQVFWNLLKNAVKFTPAAGSIHIRSADSADFKEVHVHIKDSGVGIRADEIVGIFEAFTQGSSTEIGGTHLFGGLGLGLAISQQVMKLHLGRIIATSAGLGLGACFTVEMPACKPPAPGIGTGPVPLAATKGGRSARPVSPPSTGSGLRILIVEDHAASRQALQRLLERRGHEVIAASSGQEACERLPEADFDLVICDIGLPDTDGYTLVQEMLQMRPGLPVIAMTGYGTENDVHKAEVAGFVSHLTKPVTVTRLEEALLPFKEKAATRTVAERP